MSSLQSKPSDRSSSCVHQSYVIGQDPDGHWLAVETHGLGGGIFRTRSDAVHFAQFECDHDPEAVWFTSEPLGLAYAKTPRADAGDPARSRGL